MRFDQFPLDPQSPCDTEPHPHYGVTIHRYGEGERTCRCGKVQTGAAALKPAGIYARRTDAKPNPSPRKHSAHVRPVIVPPDQYSTW